MYSGFDPEGQPVGGRVISKEERLLGQEEDSRQQLSQSFQCSFRCLRSNAPQGVRVHLALPHSFTHIVKHDKFGDRFGRCLFIPTDFGDGSEFRDQGPTDRDRERLQLFIDTVNGLIPQGGGDRCRDLAQFTPADFAFETIPEVALRRPLFNREELRELLSAGREYLELYGITVRDFLVPYFV
ncbi:hypothetical protein LXA43DRAFT_425622 [Ganoderma leucocontextum]|nr:hypothetical protein LXA43DRAFT_425622 [Ganoderma leucocontextum]